MPDAAMKARPGYFVDQAGLIQHPEYEFLAASPDGLIDNDGVLEIKCPFSARETGQFKPLEQQPQLPGTDSTTPRLWPAGLVRCVFLVAGHYTNGTDRL